MFIAEPQSGREARAELDIENRESPFGDIESWACPQANLRPFSAFPCPARRRASVSGEARKTPKGLWRRLGGGRGTCSPERRRAASQAVADGSSPSRLPWSHEAPTPHLLYVLHSHIMGQLLSITLQLPPISMSAKPFSMAFNVVKQPKQLVKTTI